MPKKFHGENSKAVVAKARKDAAKQAEEDKRQREIEDALWADDDKHVQRKQQRKDDKAKKRQEVMERKAQAKVMEEEEMNDMKSAKNKIPAPQKVTRAEINLAQEQKQSGTIAAPKAQTHDEVPIEENINRLVVDGEEARTVEEAIAVLSVKEPEQDRHPEKRMKAAYQAFEDGRLPVLKAENPNLRLSQLKQMLKKDWMKSPENPLNQRFSAYNASK